MNFYSTYYKKQANYSQISEINKKFEEMDLNGDNALGLSEFSNIFASPDLPAGSQVPFTTEQIQNLMLGSDDDDDGFITYLEFAQVYTELDIDKDAQISQSEGEFALRKANETQIQIDINNQYKILNSITSTEAEKKAARAQIDELNVQRNLSFGQLTADKLSIQISEKEIQINEIDTYIATNTLLPYEIAKQEKQREKLSVEKDLLLFDKNIALSKRDIQQATLNLMDRGKALAATSDQDEKTLIGHEISRIQNEKIKAESELSYHERMVEIHHNNVKIQTNENLLTKFFIPEFLKDNARDELEELYDNNLLAAQRAEMFNDLSNLSATRSRLYQALYDRDSAATPEAAATAQAEAEQLNTQEDRQILETTLSSKKVELYDTRINLKALALKSDRSEFVSLKAQYDNIIATLEVEIADLEAQLG